MNWCKLNTTAHFVLVLEPNHGSSRETHCPPFRFQCLFPNLYLKRWTNIAGATGINHLPFSVFCLQTHSTSNLWSMTYIAGEPRLWFISYTVILSSLQLTIFFATKDGTSIKMSLPLMWYLIGYMLYKGITCVNQVLLRNMLPTSHKLWVLSLHC